MQDSQDTLGLIDDGPAVEGPLEPLGEHLASPDRPLLQDADRGHVRQSLQDPGIGLGEPLWRRVEGSRPR